MKFKVFIPLVLISTLFLYVVSTNKGTQKNGIETQIKYLSKCKEIPNNLNDEIAFFKDSCTKQQLLALMHFKKPIIRAFAFCAMLERKDIDVFPILRENLSDTTLIMWWYYSDAGNTVYLSDFYINKASNRISKSQLKELKNLILTKHSYLQNTYWIMEEMEPEERYYKLIKGFSQKKNDLCNRERAVLALSKFKKQEDLLFIKHVIQKSECEFLSFKLIEHWPHEVFFNVLLDYAKTKILNDKRDVVFEIDDFCYATASYKNKKAAELLKKIITIENYKKPTDLSNLKESVYRAVRFYNCTFYHELITNLNLEIDPYLELENDDYFERYNFDRWYYAN